MILFDNDFIGDIRVEHPELGSISEFSYEKLSQQEINFVWCIGNRTNELYISPNDTNGKSKIKKALKKCRIDKSLSVTDLAKWESGNFHDNVKVAIGRMIIFNPSFRMRAKLMAEKTFYDAEKKITNGELEMDKKIEIILKLPLIIKSIEEGFGYKEKISMTDKNSTRQEPTVFDSISAEEEIIGY